MCARRAPGSLGCSWPTPSSRDGAAYRWCGAATSSASRQVRGTRRYAEELGLALQLTNILRDVPADLARDRLYVPLDELAEVVVVGDDCPHLRGH